VPLPPDFAETSHILQWRSRSGNRPDPTCGIPGTPPVNRSKQGTKRHIIVTCNGLSLSIIISGADIPDSKALAGLTNAIPLCETAKASSAPAY